MDVYQDFYSYKTGIYTHVSGAFVGGHAVRVIGWGVASGVNYWLIANSWGTSWGEQGYIRIAFGNSNIDKAAYACKPAV